MTGNKDDDHGYFADEQRSGHDESAHSDRVAEARVALDDVGAFVGALVATAEVHREENEEEDDHALAADCVTR